MTQGTVTSATPQVADSAGLAGETVRRIMHLASAIRHYQDVDIAELGLTPAVARALHELDPDHPVPARDLAEQLRCDRSNVTALVDKLERAGLVERRVDPADRRLKTLVVTEVGREVRARVHQVLSDSRLLAALGADELAALRQLVWKVSGSCAPPDCGPD
ncbi:MarR family transcriptional regulator [Micromonospora echinospora]|uniref:Transcriptional regulator, MarR family n=1 Tax=Micromonospora echinospora TaxID=1877 RepID=A0A1C4Y887_MICEC|nr:MarR family winged helix-turn-helix transcriptional regulator [Micromonospora echinospora]OZV84516.1 MarR family transcriptional regulator [Micromonospora echinospora]SCF16938.1 transcriptional regulator, MarR family [Micromonospora echinospora]